MLTRLKIDGFKNLVGVDVRFGPFTCIAGANGVGKSNLFDAIRFLSLTANHPLLKAAQGVRDESGANTDIRGLFHRIGANVHPRIEFEAEMIVPPEAVDDLGQIGKAGITFLRYRLVLRPRESAGNGSGTNPLEIVEEKLEHILRGDAPRHLLFPHVAATWRNAVVIGRRSGVAFISTSQRPGDGSNVIKLHQDGGADGGARGRAYERAAASLPRTVLSSATAAESPTALCARRELQSWRLLQLEPTALRQPDAFSAPSHLESNGQHLAANLARLAPKGAGEATCAKLSNRLSELVGNIRSIRVDRDEKRELLTVMATGLDGTELPARGLSDGTLRFLALSVLELDSETPALLCLEEPENGIHPDRIPAMLSLLQDIAVDPNEPADETNPLRQVIINTHSPTVVMAVPDEAILLARPVKDVRDDQQYLRVEFACLQGNWRTRAEEESHPIATKGEMVSYLNPAEALRNPRAAPSRTPRVIDHPELALNPA